MENPAILLRRLNPYCARALEGAASLCQTRAHADILPEHWLLKLLEQGEGDLTVLARRYEWDMDNLWQQLLGWLDNLPRSVRARPQLSDNLQNLLREAWMRASLAGETHIRGVHLLMALVNKPGLLRCDSLWPLLTLGQSQLESLRRLLDAQSDERPEVQQQESLDQAPSSLSDSNAPVNSPDGVSGQALSEALQGALDKFTEDVTAKAREGRIDPVFGRDTEIRQMVDILSRRRKNNPILVGEPGVGKTALVEGLALRIADGNVPESLKTVVLRTLDLGLLQAGAGVKGEFEQRLKNVIDAVQRSPVPVLLFIDEAHTIIGAGNQAGGADAANLLKPALARGELRTIAATTWSEYKQYFERDAALERRFQQVKVGEPDDDTACLMLRGLKSRYAQHHGVHITDEAVKAAVSLSRRYITGRQLPDKAVDLLDTAGARVRMSLDTVPEAITYIKAQRTALQMEAQALHDDGKLGHHHHDERLAALEVQTAALDEELTVLDARYAQEKALVQRLLDARRDDAQADAQTLAAELETLQGSAPLLSADVDVRTVANVIADWTGVPLSSLMKDEQTELLTLDTDIGQRVVGQDSALHAIAQRLQAAKTGLTPENGPQGVFLLTGPSGTGKTETALALADALYGGEKSLITINLSEYQEPHTVSQLKGSPPGYVGYGQGGILTEAVRRRPYSVVLLDEVEKAHRDVMNLFYQVFDRGFMRDGEGREIDFRNTVILMTSNLGSDAIMQMLDEQPEATDGDLQELLRPTLRDHFQPALLARFQTVIYRPLNEAAMRRIVAMKLAQVSQRLARHYGLEMQSEESLFDALTAACLLPDTGARNVDSLLGQQILPVLSQQLLLRMAQKQKPQRLSLGWSEEEGVIMEFDGPEIVAQNTPEKAQGDTDSEAYRKGRNL